MQNKISPKEKINFDFFKELPLDEVAKCLGMYPSKGGKYRSPLHTDVNPSLTIQMDETKPYYNRWKDWSFNECGGAIELVMASKFKIAPTTYWADKSAYKKQLFEAVHFLNDYFPGGIEYTEEGKKDMPKIPKIPKEILEAIGLDNNPFFDNKVASNRRISQDYGIDIKKVFSSTFDNTINMFMSERALIVLDKLKAYEKNCYDYSLEVIKNFPDLDEKATEVILSTANKWIEKVQPYIKEVSDYYFDMAEIEYPVIDFEEEADKLFGSIDKECELQDSTENEKDKNLDYEMEM
mgnify:FL=1|jgi:hypothetical protein